MLFYLKTHLKRGMSVMIVLAFLLCIVCIFSCFFEHFMERKKMEIETAYDVIPVTVVVSNLIGTQTDDLEIFDYIVNYFLSEHYVFGGELQPRAFSSYVKDVVLKSTVYYSTEDKSNTSIQQKLIGITTPQAVKTLSALEGGEITFFTDVDSEIFSSDAQVCVVSKAYWDKISSEKEANKKLSLRVQMSPAETQSQDINLEIIGTYSTNSEAIYCPWNCVAALQQVLDGKVTADSLKATVRNNQELEEFRTLLARHIAEVYPSGHQEEIDFSPVYRSNHFDITVQDETLRETLNALNRNLQTLYRFRPLFIGIEFAICFLSCFFYIQSRRREWAIARSLGTFRYEVLMIIFLEVLLLCFMGIGTGSAGCVYFLSSALPIPILIGMFFSAIIGAETAGILSIETKRMYIWKGER